MGSQFPAYPQDPAGSEWEPEPLHIPLDLPEPRPQRGRDREPEEEESPKSDLPGSHVVVIDVA